MSSWSCCKEEEPPKSKPQSMEVLKPIPKVKPLVVPVAYVLKHEEDDDELGQQEQEKLRQEQEKQRQEQEKQRQEQEKQKQSQNHQESSGQDDAVTQPSTSASETMREAGTQTNPHCFPKSPAKVTLDEILRGMQRIQMTMDHTVRDFEQRISRLERIVLKMRNAWIHHRTCHLEGLEYDDEQED
ncbi:uncharacterized protein LOC144583657 [Pogona vitticeps]|nr:probable serine/threonine-protein kinase irlA [Pogona vitticeps]XP_020641239.1 probable serine/threonine-protein kinase irlA [Pogona vitticeps]